MKAAGSAGRFFMGLKFAPTAKLMRMHMIAKFGIPLFANSSLKPSAYCM